MRATPARIDPGFSLRPATAADIPAIAAIYAHHVKTGTASFETEPPADAEMLNRMTAILDRGLPYLAAEQDGRIAGYAYAGPYRPRHAYRFTVENSIYLDPSFMGRGIGALLLDALISECKARDLMQMIAVIGDSANHASIRLHEKCGFAHIGVLKDVGFKFDRWLDTVFMQRAL